QRDSCSSLSPGSPYTTLFRSLGDQIDQFRQLGRRFKESIETEHKDSADNFNRLCLVVLVLSAIASRSLFLLPATDKIFLYDIREIGRAHVCSPVPIRSRRPSY